MMKGAGNMVRGVDRVVRSMVSPSMGRATRSMSTDAG
jgi:hypothetical protein